MGLFKRRETTTVYNAEDKLTGMTVVELRSIFEEYQGSRYSSPKVTKSWTGTIKTLTFIDTEHK